MFEKIKKLAIYFNHSAISFCVGAVLVMFIDTYITKGIDSSFISAIMDTIMAVATISAVLVAKNYLKQFTAQEGYKIAIELINNHIRGIEQLDILSEAYDSLLNEIRKNEHVLPKRNHIESTDKAIRSFAVQIVRTNNFIKEHNEYIFKLRTYGLSVSDEKLYDYSAMKDGLNEINEICNELYKKSQRIRIQINNQFDENVKRDYNYERKNEGTMFSLSRFKNLSIDNYSSIKELSQKTISHYKLFIGEDNSVIKLFKAK
ncbi:hypothetical protein ACP3TB_17085 [Rahnella variigena]|uniref:hypothetical protein n=1 Tax=Rahnella variigena TaxID=574964 RepID=UPI003CF747F1